MLEVTGLEVPEFQYRKRYGLHAIESGQVYAASGLGFNTASGMDCMQLHSWRSCGSCREVSIPQAVWIACNGKINAGQHRQGDSFNTASGMDCMQFY